MATKRTTRRRRTRRGLVNVDLIIQGIGAAGGLALSEIVIEKIPVDAVQENPAAKVALKVVGAGLILKYGKKYAPKLAPGIAAGFAASAAIDVWQGIDPASAPERGVEGYYPVDGYANGYVNAYDPTFLPDKYDTLAYDSVTDRMQFA